MLQIDILELHSPVFLPVKGRVVHRMANEPAQAASLQTGNALRRPSWNAAKTKTQPRKTQGSQEAHEAASLLGGATVNTILVRVSGLVLTALLDKELPWTMVAKLGVKRVQIECRGCSA